MRKILLATAFLLAAAPIAWAQSDRRGEFFAGYSNLQAEGVPDRTGSTNPFSSDFFDRRKGLHGVNLSGTGYFNSVLGFKGDFSFHRTEDSTSVTNGRDSINTNVFYFMGGPVLKARNASRIEPFVHALAGGAHTRFEALSERN